MTRLLSGSIPARCERLKVGDRVLIISGYSEGKAGTVFKILSEDGGYMQVAIDEDTPYCAPGEEQWHPHFVRSSLELITE